MNIQLCLKDKAHYNFSLKETEKSQCIGVDQCYALHIYAVLIKADFRTYTLQSAD